MPSPLVKIYERASGWVAELWAVSEDDAGNRTEALLEIDGDHPRWLDAFERAGDALRRALQQHEESRR